MVPSEGQAREVHREQAAGDERLLDDGTAGQQAQQDERNQNRRPESDTANCRTTVESRLRLSDVLSGRDGFVGPGR
ncbi:MAG: hypothetical protein ABEH61_00175 [Haloarculaceae archaeon]